MFKDNLAMLRRANNLSQEEVAEKVNVSRQAYAKWERGESVPDIEKCADDIVYISGGRIVAAMPKDGFVKRYSQAGETLEETFLRLERGDGNA